VKLTEKIFELSKECGTCSVQTNHSYSRNCFVALTLRELFPICEVIYSGAIMDVHTCVKLIVYTFEAERVKHSIKLPQNVYDYIQAWDAPALDYFQQTIPVEQTHVDFVVKARRALPLISFELDVPDELINSIGISQVYKILSENPQRLELIQP
jgi:hypothetical protein